MMMENATLLYEQNREALVQAIPTFLLDAVVFLVGSVGNVAVLHIYIRYFHRSSSWYFIVTLAVYDFLHCIVVVPLDAYKAVKFFIYTSTTLCQVTRLVTNSTVMGTMVILIDIAINTYIKVCHPLYFVRKHTIWMMCGVSVLFTIPFNLPFTFTVFGVSRFNTTIPGLQGYICMVKDDVIDSHVLTIYHALLGIFFVVVVFSLVIFYTLILLKVRKRRTSTIGQKISSFRRQRFEDMIDQGLLDGQFAPTVDGPLAPNNLLKPRTSLASLSDNETTMTTATSGLSPYSELQQVSGAHNPNGITPKPAVSAEDVVLGDTDNPFIRNQRDTAVRMHDEIRSILKVSGSNKTLDARKVSFFFKPRNLFQRTLAKNRAAVEKRLSPRWLLVQRELCPGQVTVENQMFPLMPSLGQERNSDGTVCSFSREFVYGSPAGWTFDAIPKECTITPGEEELVSPATNTFSVPAEDVDLSMARSQGAEVPASHTSVTQEPMTSSNRDPMTSLTPGSNGPNSMTVPAVCGQSSEGSRRDSRQSSIGNKDSLLQLLFTSSGSMEIEERPTVPIVASLSSSLLFWNSNFFVHSCPKANQKVTKHHELQIKGRGKVTSKRLDVDKVTPKRVDVDKVTSKRLDVDKVTSKRVDVDKVNKVTSKCLDVDKVTSRSVDAHKITSDSADVGKGTSKCVGVNKVTSEPVDVGKGTSKCVGVNKVTSEPVDVDKVTSKCVDVDQMTFRSDVVAEGDMTVMLNTADEARSSTETVLTTRVTAKTDTDDTASVTAKTDTDDTASVTAKTDTASVTAKTDTASVTAKTDTASVTAKTDTDDTASVTAKTDTASVTAKTDTASVTAKTDTDDTASVTAKTDTDDTASVTAKTDTTSVTVKTDTDNRVSVTAKFDSIHRASLIARCGVSGMPDGKHVSSSLSTPSSTPSPFNTRRLMMVSSVPLRKRSSGRRFYQVDLLLGRSLDRTSVCLCVVVVTFLLCYIPAAVTIPLMSTDAPLDRERLAFSLLVYRLVYIQHMLHPIIYVIFNRTFRQHIRTKYHIC